MPTEWPAQSVTAQPTRKMTNASQVKRSGPPISAIAVIAPIQMDFTGFQRTTPREGSAPTSAIMRSEPFAQSIAASYLRCDLIRLLSRFSGRDTGQTS